MKIATYANARTTLELMEGKRKVYYFSLGCRLGEMEIKVMMGFLLQKLSITSHMIRFPYQLQGSHRNYRTMKTIK
jgi:hypothetical protein